MAIRTVGLFGFSPLTSKAHRLRNKMKKKNQKKKIKSKINMTEKPSVQIIRMRHFV